jgi:hypothetical protein
MPWAKPRLDQLFIAQAFFNFFSETEKGISTFFFDAFVWHVCNFETQCLDVTLICQLAVEKLIWDLQTEKVGTEVN